VSSEEKWLYGQLVKADKDQSGALSPSELYGVFLAVLRMRREGQLFKRIAIVAAVAAVFLALCTLGTSTAAAFLSKDSYTQKKKDFSALTDSTSSSAHILSCGSPEVKLPLLVAPGDTPKHALRKPRSDCCQ